MYYLHKRGYRKGEIKDKQNRHKLRDWNINTCVKTNTVRQRRIEKRAKASICTTLVGWGNNGTKVRGGCGQAAFRV
jgi:hypothetical protein